MKCQYCGKECKNKNSLAQHERLCKFNPNKQESNFTKHNYNKLAKHSNKYIKAKEEGYKIIISDETRYKLGNGFRNKHHNDNIKKQISNTLKQYLDEHPDKIPFLLNHSHNQSYPEKYFEELFIKENIPLKYHKRIGRYELDFYNEDLMKYIEIDGEQHYTENGIEHDKKRTIYLENLGWKGIRIRWSKYLKLDFNKKQDVINNIINFLNNGTQT